MARYWRDPADCIIRTVGFGGDTDTTAAMVRSPPFSCALCWCCSPAEPAGDQVGAIMGAMHGTSWMPKHWYDNLENGDYGRDYCIRIARYLHAQHNLHKTQT